MRTVIAGLAGGMAMNLAMLLTFRAIGFGWYGHGILITSPCKARNLSRSGRSWNAFLVVANPVPIAVGLLLFGIGHAFIYKWPQLLGH